MSWNESPQPVTIRTARRIGDFEATVVIEESASDDLEITQHPVQRGAAITDHAFIKPAGLSTRVIFSDELRPLADTYRMILELQSSREPFDVVTGKRVYRSMLMKSVSVVNDKATENILALSITLQEVIIVDVVYTSVPPRAQQKMPGKTGATQKAGPKAAKPTERAKSGLRILIGG